MAEPWHAQVPPPPPPPFPFPERWPQLFARPYASRQWLTPFVPLSSISIPVVVASVQPSAGVRRAQEVDVEETRDHEAVNEDTDGEYEYGYVLSDEWRTRFMKGVPMSSHESSSRDGYDSSSDTSSSPRWRQRGLSNPRPRHRHQDQRQHSRPRQRGTSKHQGKKLAPRQDSQLQFLLQQAHELEQSRQELRRSWAPGSSGSNASGLSGIHQLESTLHAQFDSFCDLRTPAVWPQGAS